ncbi:ovalbumin-like isoform X3 [Equus quagga]|uniref:ovalbumin-like isoform X3 n=1 Tax=Equus quagga TaxID=89248 RepID=UPI001EE1A134|nr:ovalbumin-like isoform X3 [Equus quagga]
MWCHGENGMHQCARDQRQVGHFLFHLGIDKQPLGNYAALHFTMASLAAANAEFCFNLFREMDNNQGNGNVFFSSLSLFAALALVRLGARGDCASQMDKMLHFNTISGRGDSSITQPGLQSQLKRVLSDINTSHKDYELSIANGLFAEKVFDIHQNYTERAERLYNAKVERVDFTNDIEDTRYKINKWIENETHGKIKNIFHEGSLSSSAVMVLVNAVYFKGKWEAAFAKSETLNCHFKSPKCPGKTVAMMHQERKFNLSVIQDPSMQVLELRYHGDISMYIMLPKSDISQTPGKAMGSLSAANAQFCFDVFKEMSYDHTAENLFFSPLSLLSALAVVLFGARGDSASQMEQVLHLKELTRAANASNTKTYLDCIEQLHKLKPENLDFKNNLEGARMQINSWIEQETKGEIKGLLSPHSLTSSDQLVLVNAISFRGTWKYAFQKDQTTAMAFKLDESQSKPVQMMRLQGHFKLGSIKEPRVQVLEMPDAEDHLSMVIVLPSEDVGLGQVTKGITYEKLKSWIGSANMKDTAVVLRLPQLRLDECHEDLTFILEALGMTDVLDHSRANLSGVTAGGGLVVSKIIHKAMLEVTEGGPESTLTNQTGEVENPETFKVDHPFLFFILHKETKTILFYGRVCIP